MPGRRQAIEQLAKEMNWWDSMQLKTRESIVHSDISVYAKNAILFSGSDYTYFETSEGERFLFSINKLPDGRERRSKSYFDGRKAATVDYDKKDPSKQERVSISRAFGGEESFGDTARPIPMKFNYVNKIPLYEAMEKAEYYGEETIPLGTCEKYLFVDAQVASTKQNFLYFLDKGTFLPLRIESYDEPDPTVGRRLWTWEVVAVDSFDGHHVAKKSVRTAYEHNPAKPPTAVRYKLTSEVVDVKFNTKFDEGKFWPHIETGAIVHDTIAGKIVAPRRTERAEGDDGLQEISVGLAVPPKVWTSYLPNVSYGLGGLLLLVSFILWRRRG